jgi:lysophospholipase L1-like esterase
MPALTFMALFLGGVCTAAAQAEDAQYWVEPMKKVHAQFTGTHGTFAQFGDSITVTMAFWAPLRDAPMRMSPELTKAYKRVQGYMVRDCWDKWKGARYGSEGGMTIRWAHENIDKWLKQHNPEVALIMFGTNDLGQLEQKEYEQKTREVVERCLRNGTVVVLSTIPPRSGMLDKSRQFAETVRKVAKELKVLLEDYFKEILDRRPDDWDGSLKQFKSDSRNEYEVTTLIARDGVHPSNPSKYKDFSKESLKRNGYVLRNHLTLLTYAHVIEQVLFDQK